MSAYVIETCILDVRDRCDACGSQAFVEVILNHSKRLKHGGTLQLCAHHATVLLPAMDPYIHYIHDERYRLTA